MNAQARALNEAIIQAGSQSALARLVGVKPQAVSIWVKLGRVSARKLSAVEKETGISRYLLRPDLFLS